VTKMIEGGVSRRGVKHARSYIKWRRYAMLKVPPSSVCVSLTQLTIPLTNAREGAANAGPGADRRADASSAMRKD